MANRVEVILRKLPEDLASIQSLYESSLGEKEIPDDLFHSIARFVEDCQRAFDWTATEIDWTHGGKKDRSPYFPLKSTPDDFLKAIKNHWALFKTPKVPGIVPAQQRSDWSS